MREAQAVTDDRAVFKGAETDCEVVFGGGGRATDFESADVAIIGT